MKILKGIFNVFLGFIMFIALAAFSSLTALRTMLSGDFLGNVIMTITEKSEELNIGSLVNSDETISTSELDKAMEEIDEYISKEEIYNQFGDLTSQFIEYYVGARDDIDTSELKATIKEVAKKYEDKTGEKIDVDSINVEIDSAKEKIKESTKENNSELEALRILSFIYNNTLYYGCIVVFVICAIIMVLVNKSILPLIKHLIIILVFNGIGNGVLGFAVTKVIGDMDTTTMTIIENLKDVFMKIAIISVIVVVLLIVLFIILKVIQKNKNNQTVSQVNQPQMNYPEQGDVIDQIRASSYDSNDLPPNNRL